MVKTTGNSTLTKTKQHHAQSQSPASAPSRSSKKKQNTNSEEIIQEPLVCIEKLETKVERLSGELNATKRVNTLLSQELDDLQQYQRR